MPLDRPSKMVKRETREQPTHDHTHNCLISLKAMVSLEARSARNAANEMSIMNIENHQLFPNLNLNLTLYCAQNHQKQPETSK